MVRMAIHVHGRVQGVFFRASTKDRADQLGVCGWVRNNYDGTVSIEAEGEESFVEKFVAWCHEGPPSAKVERVDVTSLEPLHYKNFEIRRG